MSWFAVDDRFWSHRKVMRLRRSEHYAAAVALWALAGSWCTGDESGKHTGQVPLDVVAGLGLPDWEMAAKTLVAVCLWEETDDAEVLAFHDWDFWNGPDAKSKRIEARRASDRARQQKRRSAARSDAGHVTDGDMSRDMSRDSPQVSQDGHVKSGNGYGNGGLSPSRVETQEQTQTWSTDDSDGSLLLVQDVAPTGKTVDDQFAEFWAAYPRKVAKQDARKAWDAQRKKTDPALILAGAVRYRDDPNRNPQYTKHPGTWLRAGCWDDETQPAQMNGYGRPAAQIARNAAFIDDPNARFGMPGSDL